MYISKCNGMQTSREGERWGIIYDLVVFPKKNFLLFTLQQTPNNRTKKNIIRHCLSVRPSAQLFVCMRMS